MHALLNQLKYLSGLNFATEIKIIGTIGAGNNVVYEVQYKQQTLAMKEIVIKPYNEQQVMTEISILQILAKHNHPFIIKFIAYMICEPQKRDDFYDSNTKFAFILMEKAQASLLNYIESRKNFLDRETIRKIMHTTIDGFKFLQDLGVAHQDIKPENILIMNLESLEIKVCDIGSGLQTKNVEQTHTITGTVPFLAPELVENFSQIKTHANPFKSDVFSLGLCLIYVISFKKINSRNRTQFDSQSYKEIIKSWMNMCGHILGQDELIMQILIKMLEVNPNSRPDFHELKLLLSAQSPQKCKSEYNLLIDSKSISINQSEKQISPKKEMLPKQLSRRGSSSGKRVEQQQQQLKLIQDAYTKESKEQVQRRMIIRKMKQLSVKEKIDITVTTNQFFNKQNSVQEEVKKYSQTFNVLEQKRSDQIILKLSELSATPSEQDIILLSLPCKELNLNNLLQAQNLIIADNENYEQLDQPTLNEEVLQKFNNSLQFLFFGLKNSKFHSNELSFAFLKTMVLMINEVR